MKLFSIPQLTIAAAAALHHYDLFAPAAVFRTKDGLFVHGYIREMNTPPVETAERMAPLGYEMVAYHGPLLDVWQAWPDDAPIREG